jgi:predicted MFS family arabinose efflux permease
MIPRAATRPPGNAMPRSSWNLWRDLDGLPSGAWSLALAALIWRAGTMVRPFLAIWMVDEAGFSKGATSDVLSAYAVVTLVVALLAGRVCDALGPGRVLHWSLVASALVMASIPFVRDLGSLPVVAIVMLLAITAEPARPAVMTWVIEVAPGERRASAFALLRLAVNLGMAIGPLVGGYLATIDFDLLFFVNAVGCGIAFVALRIWRPKSHEHADADAMPDVAFLRTPGVVPLLLTALAFAIVFFQLEGTFALWLTNELGHSERLFGQLFLVNTILIVLFEVRLVSWCRQNLSPSTALALGGVFLTLGFGGHAFATSVGGIIACAVLWTIAEMIFMPLSADRIASLAARRKRGAAMGWLATSYNIGSILAPQGVRPMTAMGANYWLLIGAIGVVATALAWWAGRSARQA